MPTTRLLSATALALMLAAGPAELRAQAQPDDPHHPSPSEQPAAPEAEAAPPPPASGPMPGMGMGMMPGRMGMMQGHMMPGQPGMGGMMHGMEGMAGAGGAGPMAEGSDDPVAAAFAAINRRMHREMAVTSSGDADRDFVAGMIAHHRAAIDMAKLLIGFGKDPELRRLADEIIAAQDAEITQMQAWLERQGQ